MHINGTAHDEASHYHLLQRRQAGKCVLTKTETRKANLAMHKAFTNLVNTLPSLQLICTSDSYVTYGAI